MSPNHMDHPSWKSYSFVDGTALGIPCKIAFTWHPTSYGAREHGTGLQLEPDEPAGYDDICLMDRKGYHASWLEERVEKADCWEDIEDQLRQGRLENAMDAAAAKAEDSHYSPFRRRTRWA